MSIDPKYTQGQRSGKVFAGLILLAVGAVLLLQQIGGFLFPHWLISWPMLLIVWGLYIGSKNNFTRPFGAAIMILIGVLFIADDIIPGLSLERAFWPLMLIFFGLYMVLGKKYQWRNGHFEKYKGGNPFGGHEYTNPFEPKGKPDPNFDPNGPTADANASGTYVPPLSGDDHIDTVSVFGGVKRTILSKNFKGGEIVNIFGGTDLDLTQADINGRVEIEIVQLFGGIKLIIPPHWQVTSDVAAVFSSVDDKRRNLGAPLSTDKLLVIKGVSIFAGVDIRSF
ncbi:hypothetical protein HQ865_16360 [Mucilaginibacter mali]|uniref:LiaF transmembrane domain-containing protein n=1 Tax=Mucilaginibacter mali TaxID=2740462 RepID=A0A7D4PVW0_9SPHI|nr:DUF5668 domain-containing protein [Mucilaginibacter mali]QKJ31263.1 hypothetical protein HQ865_16360 [Mucilaginibacter mali]